MQTKYNIVNLNHTVQLWFGTLCYTFPKGQYDKNEIRSTIRNYCTRKGAFSEEETESIIKQTLRACSSN